MKLYEISKQEFKDKLQDPRHAQVQARLNVLESLLEEYGWELEWKRMDTPELDYDVNMTVGTTPEQRAKRDEHQITSSKVRIAFKNAFNQHGPGYTIPDIVVREADKTPTRVTMWIMHDEEADE